MANKAKCEVCGRFVRKGMKRCKVHQPRIMRAKPTEKSKPRSNVLSIIERYGIGEAVKQGADPGNVAVYFKRLGSSLKKVNAAIQFARKAMAGLKAGEGVNEKWGSYSMALVDSNRHLIEGMIQDITAAGHSV